MPRLCRRALGLVVPLLVCCPALVHAQGTKAGVVTTLEGSVTATRAALAGPVALKFKDDVFMNDRVVTGDRSIARLLLGGKAVVTVRERSALTITELPGRSTIALESGKIAVAVVRDKMRSGETIEVKTPNAVAAVRGTVFVAEVTQTTAARDAAQSVVTSAFYGFAGQVLVTVASQVLTLSPDMFISATGFQPATLGAMTADIRARALAGLQTKRALVREGQESAKNLAFGSTATTVGAALPDVATPQAATTLTPPALPRVDLLPGGVRRIDTSAVSIIGTIGVGTGGGGGGCGCD